MTRLCVFCGSRTGRGDAYRAAARELGAEMARRGIGLVFGGGKVGLMGVLADAVLEAGGEVIGVIPHGLMAREVGHTGVRDLRVVASMHERKAEMARLSDGFIALPGGLGTLEELFEAITWLQLGIHTKPCGLLDVGGYWEPLLACIDRAVEEGFVDPASRAFFLAEPTSAALLDRMRAYRPPARASWLEPHEI